MKLWRLRTKKFDSGYDGVLDTMRARLDSMQVRVPRRPKNADGGLLEPRLPTDITALSPEGLGKLYNEFSCMAQYAQFQLALRSVEHAVTKRVDRLTKARVRLEKAGTNDDKAAKVEVDPRSRKSSLEQLTSEGEERLTQAVLDVYLIGKDTCSREMTRRLGMMKNDR